MQINTTVKIADLEEMERFAKTVAGNLRGGEVIGLVGDLGAGKTAMVQALARAMGIGQAVRSPTFILMQCFRTAEGFAKSSGITELCHIDAYRLETEDELFAIGFGEYAEREDAVTVIEWADRIESLSWLEDYREIRYGFGEGTERILTVDGRLLPHSPAVK